MTPLGSQVVLGTSFTKDYETRITIGKTSSLYIRGKPVELLQLGSPSQPVLSVCKVAVEPERDEHTRHCQGPRASHNSDVV